MIFFFKAILVFFSGDLGLFLLGISGLEDTEESDTSLFSQLSPLDNNGDGSRLETSCSGFFESWVLVLNALLITEE